MMRNRFMIAFVAMALAASASASEQVGTLTQITGDVKIFTNPSKTPDNPAPRALFEGEYFTVREAKIGDRLDRLNILRTAPGAKARIVFDNGDQYNVGPGTAYRVNWENDTAKGKPEVKLMYGKLRGIVSKGGPRSGLNIRTRSATMAVRGTDFFISDEGVNGTTEVSILRGQVEVKPLAANAKPIQVNSGYSAVIEAPASKPVTSAAGQEAKVAASAPKVELKKTTKEDLVYIHKESHIRTALKTEVRAPAETKQEILALERKATENTLQDIKRADPTLFAKLQEKKDVSVEELNAKAVETLVKEAPRGPARVKPGRHELENLEQGAYEKYFRVE